MNRSHDIIFDIWKGNGPTFDLLHLGWAAHAPPPAMELCCCPQVQHGADMLLACRKCALIRADSHGTGVALELQKRATWVWCMWSPGQASPAVADRRQGHQSHQSVPSPQALLPCSSSLFLLPLPSLPSKTFLSKGEAGDVLEDVKTFLYSYTSSAKVMFILCSCQRGSATQRPLLP